jgi:thiosulfate/3-mercaptopyruvate sulfurtransferase
MWQNGDAAMRFPAILCLFAVLALTPLMAVAAPGDALKIPAAVQIQPAELAVMLKSPAAPPVLQVGFAVLYQQAHIPGAQYAGPGNAAEGLDNLKSHVAALPHDKLLVIYCGCCPWEKCPNIAAAYNQLTMMGFSKVKVLYLPSNFGADWVDKGYPVTRGG